MFYTCLDVPNNWGVVSQNFHALYKVHLGVQGRLAVPERGLNGGSKLIKDNLSIT